ncbi:MAG: AAA family ATPase [Paenibacillus dendritiformis]|uniref:AAA family ATPase n=1 Tax=uncultured Paenibacillus sp. TaxID=227322 RepID=UPI0025CEA207|nr:AAA family ATPase [uncultured Paenibacillus sp.]MDU5141091.1 AAA family ATPase [Paenibacillus dendritiformis]
MKVRIQTYMREQGLSQSATAKLLGIGESTLSRYLSGTYPNPESIEMKISDLLEKEELRQTVTGLNDIPFALTSISQQVMKTLEYARIKRNISVIYGDAGIGKTRTAKEWARGKTDVVLLTVSPALGNPKSFFKYLARELKTVKNGHIDDLYLELCDRLTGSDKMIVIDEAQHLTLKTLENIRGIQETADVAIVLIGNEMIYTKMVGRQQAEFAQLFSRIGWRKHLLTDHFVQEDVQKVFGGHLDEEALRLLLDICHSKYGLRGAEHVYINSSNNGDVSAKGLRAMSRTMGIVL